MMIYCLSAMRIKQWPKQLLIFLPLLAANKYEFSYKILAGIDEKKYHGFIQEYPASAFVNIQSKSYSLLKNF